MVGVPQATAGGMSRVCAVGPVTFAGGLQRSLWGCGKPQMAGKSKEGECLILSASAQAQSAWVYHAAVRQQRRATRAACCLPQDGACQLGCRACFMMCQQNKLSMVQVTAGQAQYGASDTRAHSCCSGETDSSTPCKLIIPGAACGLLSTIHLVVLLVVFVAGG